LGKIPLKRSSKINEEKNLALSKKSMIKSGAKAELSLSIKGHKQNISMISLKIKNLRDLQSKEGNALETLQKIVNLAEEHKAATYENNNDLFFLFIPTKTRTFGNEKNALNISRKIKGIIEEHNKKFNQKIDFGISLSNGNIVSDANRKSKEVKFTSLGNLMGSSKATRYWLDRMANTIRPTR